MSMDDPFSVSIQSSAEPIPSVPAWFGEVALIAHTLTRLGLLTKISDEVRFARKRFGIFEVIDFVVVLMGYAISGEPTRASYYERLHPFGTPFMALFGRNQLPHRSTLSRFLAALDQTCVEALRSVFLQDALARPGPAEGVGGLWDRQGKRWVVFDLDGTRQAADSVHCLRVLICHLHSGVCARCARLATWGASVERWFAPARRSYKPIPISGSSRIARSGQRGLPRRAVAGAGCGSGVSAFARSPPCSSPCSPRWVVWQRNHRCRSDDRWSWLGDARQRLWVA